MFTKISILLCELYYLKRRKGRSRGMEWPIFIHLKVLPGPELSTQMEKGFSLSASSSVLAAIASKSSNWKVDMI